jgi:hypothetical protein
MKKRLTLLLAIIMIGGLVMNSCAQPLPPYESSADISVELSQSEISEETSDPAFYGNLAEGCPYFYEYGANIEGDDNITALTDPENETVVRLTPSLSDTGKATFKTGDWSGTQRELELDNTKAGIYVDLGFICDIESFELVSNVAECEIFYSTDGYNYTFYAGAFGKSGTLSISAKSVLFMIPFGDGIEISRIKIIGRREHARTLLSRGAAYTWKASRQYPDESGTKLTDGDTYAVSGKDALAQARASNKDEITGKEGVILDMDLGRVCNISEVIFGLYSSSYPERICVRYSEDNEKWDDLGQSYLRTFSGIPRSASKLYSVTRPDTVKARYLRVYFYTTNVITDEICVYGCADEVKVNYEFLCRKNRSSDANIAQNKALNVDGKEESRLTDGSYYNYYHLLSEKGSIEYKVEKKRSVCGASVTYRGAVASLEIECDGRVPGNLFEYTASAGSIKTSYFYFDAAEIQNVTVKYTTSGKAWITEVQIYGDAPQLPVVRGGFAQIFTGMESTVSEMNSDYSWYLFVKGMRDLGMEYLILSETADIRTKTTLLNSGRTVDAGYKYEQVYGTTDVLESILKAADELGLDVFLGTIIGVDFAKPAEHLDAIDKVIKDSELVIRDLNEKYGHHKSVIGYYLNDEQCDYWMCYAEGVKYGRMVYKAQSDLIRELDPEAKIMISPAIWRSGGYVNAGKAIYEMIKPEVEGGRPIVDIVSAQDCLGRTAELYVKDDVFDEFGKYCEEWAKNVRAAEAVFWHDAEVFEQTYTYKRYKELVRSFGYEAKLSGTIIVFDIPHYLSPFPLASYNNERQYYGRCIMREYVKYYSGFSELNSK